MRIALEISIETSLAGMRYHEFYVPGITPWIFIAGDAVYDLCKIGKRDDGSLAEVLYFWDEAVTGVIYSGRDGFYLDRWTFWKNRLREMANILDTYKTGSR
jgi:hypothetical protein